MTSFYAAALFAAFTYAVHVVAGGRHIARPLLRATDMSEVARYTNYYCWHLVTLTLLAMVIAFALAASSGSRELGGFATALAAAFMAWNVVLIGWKRLKIAQYPQWVLFLPVVLCGAIGLT